VIPDDLDIEEYGSRPEWVREVKTFHPLAKIYQSGAGYEARVGKHLVGDFHRGSGTVDKHTHYARKKNPARRSQRNPAAHTKRMAQQKVRRWRRAYEDAQRRGNRADIGMCQKNLSNALATLRVVSQRKKNPPKEWHQEELKRLSKRWNEKDVHPKDRDFLLGRIEQEKHALDQYRQKNPPKEWHQARIEHLEKVLAKTTDPKHQARIEGAIMEEEVACQQVSAGRKTRQKNPQAGMRGDRHKTPTSHTYRYYHDLQELKEALQTRRHFHILDRKGDIASIRANGRLKTWKRDPNRIQQSFKYGLYEHFKLTGPEMLAQLVIPEGE